VCHLDLQARLDACGGGTRALAAGVLSVLCRFAVGARELTAAGSAESHGGAGAQGGKVRSDSLGVEVFNRHGSGSGHGGVGTRGGEVRSDSLGVEVFRRHVPLGMEVSVWLCVSQFG
jgi:hypothetical protein